MGMRHLIVLDLDGVVVGIVTRKDLCHLPHMHHHASTEDDHGRQVGRNGGNELASPRSTYFKGIRNKSNVSSNTNGAAGANNKYVSFGAQNRSPEPTVLGFTRNQRSNSTPSALPSWLEDRGEVTAEDLPFSGRK
jgi:hypothetical protein